MLIWTRIDVVAFEGEKVRWRARAGGVFHSDFYFSFNLSLHEFLNRESQTNGGGFGVSGRFAEKRKVSGKSLDST
jgi:hypothetical protein